MLFRAWIPSARLATPSDPWFNYALSLGPKIWYRKNEASGTVLVDSTPSGVNGQYTNVTLNQTGLVRTSPTKSVKYSVADGSKATVEDDLYSQLTGEATLLWWWKYANFGAIPKHNIMFDRIDRVGTLDGYQFKTDPDSGNIELRTFNNGAQTDRLVTLSPININDGTTHFIVCRVSPPSQFEIRVDNVVQYSEALGSPVGASPGIILYIGAENGTSNMDGFLDEIMFFPRSLTNAEISQLWTLGRP